MEMSKTKKLPSRKKIALELLHQRLGHRSTRSLLAGYTDNVWEDIELIIYPDLFCTLCQISSMNKKASSKIPTGTKTSVSHLHVLISPCVVQKATSHVGTKALNMRHQAQQGF